MEHGLYAGCGTGSIQIALPEDSRQERNVAFAAKPLPSLLAIFCYQLLFNVAI